MQYIMYFNSNTLHCTQNSKKYRCPLSFSERSLFHIHLFTRDITMHAQILFNLATLAVTAYAAASSSLSVSLEQKSVVELTSVSQRLITELLYQDNPEAQYLTQTNTDGQVTGQRRSPRPLPIALNSHSMNSTTGNYPGWCQQSPKR